MLTARNTAQNTDITQSRHGNFSRRDNSGKGTTHADWATQSVGLAPTTCSIRICFDRHSLHMTLIPCCPLAEKKRHEHTLHSACRPAAGQSPGIGLLEALLPCLTLHLRYSS